MRKVIGAVGLFFVLSTASVAKAQTRGRFWISSGVGVGSFNGDGVDVVMGLTGYVGGGLTVQPILLLGVECAGPVLLVSYSYDAPTPHRTSFSSFETSSLPLLSVF